MMNGDSCVSLLVSPTMLQSAAFGRTADRSRIIPIAIPDAVPFGGNRTGRKTLRQKVYSMNLYGLLRKECDELISAWVTAAMVLNGIAWTMMSALIALIFSVGCALRGIPKHGIANPSRSKGDWDIVSQDSTRDCLGLHDQQQCDALRAAVEWSALDISSLCIALFNIHSCQTRRNANGQPASWRCLGSHSIYWILCSCWYPASGTGHHDDILACHNHMHRHQYSSVWTGPEHNEGLDGNLTITAAGP